jgi:hypothetical protein
VLVLESARTSVLALVPVLVEDEVMASPLCSFQESALVWIQV